MRRNWQNNLFAVLVISTLLLAQPASQAPISDVRRLSTQPIVAPQPSGFSSAGAFNPAVIKRGRDFIMLYRAQDDQGTSRLGYATSIDGIHFQSRDKPVFVPETDYEKDGGVEDPRLVEIAGAFYLTYTGYNKKDAQLCLAVSKDLIHWERQGVILPAYKGNWNVGWTKSGAILTERINGKYWMYFLGTAADKTDQTGLASSDDLVHWTEASKTPVLPRRPGQFDSRVVEPGPPPVLMPEGILLFYNGADDQLVYRLSWALFDKNDPGHLLARGDTPLLSPELEWEKVGQVPNVIFVEGVVREGKRWLFYYGGADKYVGVAEGQSR